MRACVLVTPGATALTRMPKNDVSKAVVSTSMLSMAIDVLKMIDPGYGAFPALLERIVMEPLLSFKKGTARETS